MGALASPADMVKRFQSASAGAPAALASGVKAAAAIMQGSVLLASGRYAGHKITRTRVTLIPGSEPRALVKMSSRKAHLLDHPTKPHDIGAGRVLAFGGNVVTGPVHHPGTRGKFMWERGLEVARPRMVAAVNDAVMAPVVKAFLA